MSFLTLSCRPFFSQNAELRGTQYFQQRRVTIDPPDEEASLTASVQGSRLDPYEVFLNWKEKNGLLYLKTLCDCPNFDDGHFCKHLWAVLLSLEKNGSHQFFPNFRSVKLLHSSEWDDNPFTISWEKALQSLEKDHVSTEKTHSAYWQCTQPKPREVRFICDTKRMLKSGQLSIEFFQREQKLSGGFGKLKEFKVSKEDLKWVLHPVDREILGFLLGIQMERYSHYYSTFDEERYSACQISPAVYEWLLPRLCATGRFGTLPQIRGFSDAFQSLAWDGQEPWEFRLDCQKDPVEQKWILSGKLVRQETVWPLSEPVVLLKSGLIFFKDCIGRLKDPENIFQWIVLLRDKEEIPVPFNQQEEFLRTFYRMPGRTPAGLPEELVWKETLGHPKAVIHFFSCRSFRQTGGKSFRHPCPL